MFANSGCLHKFTVKFVKKHKCKANKRATLTSSEIKTLFLWYWK